MGTIQEAPDWRERYEASSGRLTVLESLSKDVLKEYDDLTKKNERLQQEIDRLQQRLESKNTDLQDVKKLIEPALTEYDVLMNKYKIEKGCRYEAQTFATHIVSQNKKLKRQSLDMLALYSSNEPVDLSALKLDLNSEPNEDTDLTKYHETLNNQITALKNETAALKTSLTQCQEDLHIEKENHKWATLRYQTTKKELDEADASLIQYKQSVLDLPKVSQEALQEYEDLRDKFELEILCKNKAQSDVDKLLKENRNMKRQSDVLMAKVLPNEQLHTAMLEIETMSEDTEKQKAEYEAQIQELKQEVEMGSKTTVDELMKERTALSELNEQLNKELHDLTNSHAILETYNLQLQKKYDVAMKPPPPPPPPPPPQIEKSRGFISRIMKRKKEKVAVEAKLKVSGANMSDSYSKAIEEMMDHIKHKKLNPISIPEKKGRVNEGHEFGVMLKSRSFDATDGKQQSDEPEKGKAMAELHKMVTKMKRFNSDSDLLTTGEPEVESEFAKKFKQIRKASVDSNVAPMMRKNQLSQLTEDQESEVTEDGESGIPDDDVFEKKVTNSE